MKGILTMEWRKNEFDFYINNNASDTEINIQNCKINLISLFPLI
jgi:hypothetical protein